MFLTLSVTYFISNIHGLWCKDISTRSKKHMPLYSPSLDPYKRFSITLCSVTQCCRCKYSFHNFGMSWKYFRKYFTSQLHCVSSLYFERKKEKNQPWIRCVKGQVQGQSSFKPYVYVTEGAELAHALNTFMTSSMNSQVTLSQLTLGDIKWKG